MRTQTAAGEKNLAANATLRSTRLNAAEVTPASSAVIAVTMIADLQDTLAALRTAALLARSLKATLSIDIFGMKSMVVPAEGQDPASLKEIVDLIHARLREITSSGTRSFVIEANITAASFLAVGGISVRLHTGDVVEGRTRNPMVTANSSRQEHR
jgi:hypothetical protein